MISPRFPCRCGGDHAHIFAFLRVEQAPAQLDDFGRVFGDIDSVLVTGRRNVDDEVVVQLGGRRSGGSHYGVLWVRTESFFFFFSATFRDGSAADLWNRRMGKVCLRIYCSTRVSKTFLRSVDRGQQVCGLSRDSPEQWQHSTTETDTNSSLNPTLQISRRTEQRLYRRRKIYKVEKRRRMKMTMQDCDERRSSPVVRSRTRPHNLSLQTSLPGGSRALGIDFAHRLHTYPLSQALAADLHLLWSTINLFPQQGLSLPLQLHLRPLLLTGALAELRCQCTGGGPSHRAYQSALMPCVL